MVSLQCLLESLDYDADTGLIKWRQRPLHHFATKRACSVWNAIYPNKEAGSLAPSGYRRIVIGLKAYQGHRLAYAIHMRIEPADLPAEIDHKDLDRSNNRAANLRAATKSQNNCNRHAHSNNTSGFKGVHWYSRVSRWMAYIDFLGVRHHLGYFDTAEAAHAAYCSAAVRLHGEFARAA